MVGSEQREKSGGHSAFLKKLIKHVCQKKAPKQQKMTENNIEWRFKTVSLNFAYTSNKI